MTCFEKLPLIFLLVLQVIVVLFVLLTIEKFLGSLISRI